MRGRRPGDADGHNSPILPGTGVKTRFILIGTSHAGNVGAVARAMKVMGFDDLVLVAPRWDDVLRRQEAIDRASGGNCIWRRLEPDAPAVDSALS